jgi:glycosyltransferase involved in cell wall biosynthesis
MAVNDTRGPMPLTSRLDGVRVLAVLNGLELFGHERGNIEVFRILRQLGAQVLVGVNEREKGGEVGDELRRLQFDTFALPFGNQWSWQWLKTEPLSVFAKIRQAIRCSAVFRAALRRFAATHVHMGSSLAYSYVAPALATCRIPMVYRMGDAPPTDSPFNLRIWRQAMRRTARLVCNSEFVRIAAIQAGASDADVIYNLASRRGDAVGSGGNSQTSERSVRLVYVGAVSAHKGVMTLVEAFGVLATEFPEILLEIVGGSRYDTEFRRELLARVAVLGLQSRVVFHGFLRDPDALYERAAIHVAPSLWEEPLGTVVLEAKRISRPSVVFPSGGLVELVNHGVDGYVCETKSVPALVGGLRWMLADRNRLQRLGAAAREDYDRRFGPERFAEQWANVYLETATRGIDRSGAPVVPRRRST